MALLRLTNECGSSNGQSHLLKQLSKDRSLQKDRFQRGENSKNKGFRSPRPHVLNPTLSTGNLVHEFFQQYEPSPFQSPSPAIYNPYVNGPLQAPILDNWIHEFQTKVAISSSPLAASTYEELNSIYTSPSQWHAHKFFHHHHHHHQSSLETSEEAFDRAFEEVQRTHSSTTDWTRAFQEYDNQQSIHGDTTTNIPRENPRDAACTWHQLGIKQQENERDHAAIAALEKAVSLDATHLDAWLALSISYTNDHRRVDAHHCLEQWVLHHPSYKHLQQQQQQPHSSLTDLFLEAARVSPGQDDMDPDVQVGLGVLLTLSQAYEKAVDCFKAALAARPEDYRLWNQVGAALQKAGDSAGAVEMYSHALHIHPLYIRARSNLAVSFMRLGQYDDAVFCLLTALALQKKTSDGPNETNETMWNSLRLLMFLMDKDFLAQECIHQNLDAFRDHFHF